MINWTIIKEPVNWLTIWSMLAIAYMLYVVVKTSPIYGQITNSLTS